MENAKKHARLFLGIALDDALKKELIAIIHTLQQDKHSHTIKWSPHNNLHLTLRFLGDVEIGKIPLLINLIENYITGHTAFTLGLNNIQMFPQQKPTVIAVMLHLSEALAKIVFDLEQAVIEFGLPAETRPFLPHITLGRLRGHQAPLALDEVTLTTKESSANEITLFQSEMNETGSIYHIIKTFPLK